jgi:hypothetical protein
VIATLLVFSLPSIAADGESVKPLLELAGGTFRPTESREAAPEWFEATLVDRAPSGLRFAVAVAAGPLGKEERRRIESTGAEILDYLPQYGYRLRLVPGAEEAVRALPFVTWVGRIPSHRKIDPGLAALAARPEASARIRVVLSSGEPESRVMALLDEHPVRARRSGKDQAWRVEATIDADSLAAILSGLASLPEVEAIEQPRELRYLNQDAVWVHQSFVGPTAQETPIFDRGIFGCDQTVAVADTGQDYDVCYFRDIPNGPPPVASCVTAPCPAGTVDLSQRKDIIYYNWSGTPTGDDDTCPATIGGSGHGTHTSGSVAGDAPDYVDCVGYTSAGRTGGDGQAPGAKLVMQELGDGLEYMVEGGGTLWNVADVAYQSGARIQSISWGGVCHDLFGICVQGCTLPYDSMARDVDLAMWTYPDLLIVLAAGNAGEICQPPNSINTPAIAKSAVTVGSLGHGAGAGTVSSYSSRGPVFDGRLKPTVAAQGEASVSAASDANPNTNNCGTCSHDGSSMSAPTVAGLAALVREYYESGFYATGERNEPAGMTPTGALLKATLIDGAVALGAVAPAADYYSGYGRVLLGSTLAFSDSDFRLWVDDHREGITTGSVVTYAFDVAAGTELRATLVWTDYPAALLAAQARVNELKLEVIDPAGNAWFQTLDEGSGLPIQTMDPADPHDAVNVEERLVFDAPAEGRWVVRVHGLDVPWDAQPFALVVRGDLSGCAAPESPAAPALTKPADGQVLVSWEPVPGAAAYNVYRSHGSCPGGPWVPVATAVTGATFLDDSVSGGTAYSYHVAATSDADAYCESARSPCASVVPDGECLLAPVFRGVTDASSLGESDCSIRLTWDAAAPFCGSEVRYNVYRDTASGFVPGPANRIARCIVGHEFVDAVDLANGTSYHYVVRAEDGTSGRGGPCLGGNEDANLAEAVAEPDGLPTVGSWIDDAGDTGEAKFTLVPPWALETSGGTTGGPNVYAASGTSGSCADLTTPALTLDDPGSGPTISFATHYDFEFEPGGILGAEGSIGEVEIALGPDFTDWTRVELSPDYPTSVEMVLSDCTAATPPDTYYTGLNTAYTTYTGSLVNWGGGDVKIRFHIGADLIYPRANWWIDDVVVTQTLVPGVCDALSAGPPPVPDGASVPGEPLRVAKSGGDLLLTWDATRCPAAEVNVYRGVIGDYASFTAGDCGLAADGSELLSMPDDSWFLVVATDGASTDGSWSRDGRGNELDYAGAGAACPAITSHVTNNGCP